jgi:hypothetical protein
MPHDIHRSNSAAAFRVGDFTTPANVEALNGALAEKGITSERIVAVHLLAGAHMAFGDNGPRYHVLYREA